MLNINRLPAARKNISRVEDSPRKKVSFSLIFLSLHTSFSSSPAENDWMLGHTLEATERDEWWPDAHFLWKQCFSVCLWCFQQRYFKGQHCSRCMSCVWWVKHQRMLAAVAMRCKSTRKPFLKDLGHNTRAHTQLPAWKWIALATLTKTEVWLHNGI